MTKRDLVSAMIVLSLAVVTIACSDGNEGFDAAKDQKNTAEISQNADTEIGTGSLLSASDARAVAFHLGSYCSSIEYNLNIELNTEEKNMCDEDLIIKDPDGLVKDIKSYCSLDSAISGADTTKKATVVSTASGEYIVDDFELNETETTAFVDISQAQADIINRVNLINIFCLRMKYILTK